MASRCQRVSPSGGSATRRATPWHRGATDDALSSTRWTTFTLTPAPAWEVKFAMGLLRHGTVPAPVSHSRREVRFAAAATLSE